MESFDFDVISRVKKSAFQGGYFRNKTIQSVCTDGDAYYIGFSWNDDPEWSTIIKTRGLAFDEMGVGGWNNLPLGHCNDMEYNPEDDKIYVAGSGKVITVVDPLTLKAEYTRNVSMYAWAIARYSDGMWFIFDGNTGYRLDGSMTVWNVAMSDCTRRIRQIAGDGYWQGAVMVDDVPYLIWTEKAARADKYKSCILFSNEEALKCETEDEVEGTCLKDGGMDFVYGQIWMGGATWDMNGGMKTIYTTVDKIDIKSGTTEIDLSKVIPEGYALVSANVNFKNGGVWKPLPFMDGNWKCMMKIYRITEDRIVLKARADYKKQYLQITGFCRRK